MSEILETAGEKLGGAAETIGEKLMPNASIGTGTIIALSAALVGVAVFFLKKKKVAIRYKKARRVTTRKYKRRSSKK